MAYGTVNADVIQSSVANTSLGAGNASIMKNRIINGAMVISQRYGTSSTTPSATASNVYILDRFFYAQSQASKFSIQQLSSSPPAGFSNYMGLTTASAVSIGSSDYFFTGQVIEGFNWADLGWGTANAKTVTLSFWVQSSLTGTFGGSLQNYNQNRSYPFSYTISSANTWTQISITVTGDTGGTWAGATNAGSLELNFGLGVGSTLSGTAGSWSANNYLSATGATSVVGTNGATFYITGVQLEVGSSATGFEYRQYGQELALCQRYAYVISGNSPYQNGYSRYPCFGSGTNGCIWYAQYPVQMRTSPSLITNSFTSSSMELYNYSTATAPTFSAITIAEGDVWHGQVVITSTNNISSGNIVSWRWQNIQNAYVGFSAEL